MSCNSSDQQTYCSSASPELKLYQAFIFSVPVFFTFILLLLFYVFYLRRRRANWQSMRMRATQLGRGEIPRSSRSGIKKEVREMLPVVVFKESFLIRETQCSVCLGDYQSDDRLQRIPPCGHTFHVDCIDHWLSTNTTCPLCRVSLLPSAITHTDPLDHQGQASGGQSEEQSVESLTSILVVHSDDVEGEVEERERVCSCNVVREVEDIRSNGEGSVTAIVADSSEENIRC